MASDFGLTTDQLYDLDAACGLIQRAFGPPPPTYAEMRAVVERRKGVR